jgi:uncharacterized membrane protein (DUF4010 family)
MSGQGINDLLPTLLAAAVAIAAGFLIGFEREWTQALEQRRHAFAGARTFTLVSFSGALCALLSEGVLLVAAGFIAIGGLTGYAYSIEARESESRGGTTEIALLAAYLLGVAAGRGETLLASAGAVAVALTLSLKDEITRLARVLNESEIHATIRFLAISVLILPIAPDRGFGPYDALNPRELWLMVVLISGLSFLGYWLAKALGGGRGALATGLVGGLASSTATTLALSRRARGGASAPVAAAGIVMANVVMVARVALILAALAPAALVIIAPSLSAAGLAGSAAALFFYRGSPRDESDPGVALGNPFELRPALIFAALLAGISLAAAYGADAFGARGLYAIAAISGLADLDAIALSAGRQTGAGVIPAGVAGAAILIAIVSNALTKGAMAIGIGGAKVGAPVIAAFVLMTLAGAGAYAFTPR